MGNKLTPNKTFIKGIQDKISSLLKEIEKIEKFPVEKGFETITSSVKRMYIYELEKLIANNNLRLENAKKEKGEIFVQLMMDQIFDGGLNWTDREGLEFVFSLPTHSLMSFEEQLEITIDITKKFNLIQCDTPLSPDKERLRYNLITGTYQTSFDLYDNYKVFENQIQSVMKDMKYIFNVEPYKEIFGDKIRLGFKIMCA